jgi:protein SCO1/2
MRNPLKVRPANVDRSVTLFVAAMLLGLWAAGSGCRPGADSASPPGPGSTGSGKRTREFGTNVTAYAAKGMLHAIRAEGWKAVIAHEDIPGYMEAMTMLLDVRNTNELAGLKPGDILTFRMLVTDTDGWIDQVKKVGSGTVPAREKSAAELAAEFTELTPGALVPDCTLTNQAGQAIQVTNFRGRALAFTFIFTRCPFPVYCPRLNQNFAAVQNALLTDSAAAQTNWHLLSISFDPEFDTPERLANYGKVYKQNPAYWTFATGLTEEIQRLGGAFTLTYWKEEKVLFNHNIRTVVVDRQGRVQRIFKDNEWKPEELVAEMKKAMQSE